MIILAIALAVQAVSPAQVEAQRLAAPQIREAFDARLLDYPSARFRDVFVTRNPAAEAELGRAGPGYLCGYVNSKNRMGAYTGWQRFTANGSDVLIAGDRIDDLIISSACGTGTVSENVDRSAWLAYR